VFNSKSQAISFCSNTSAHEAEGQVKRVSIETGKLSRLWIMRVTVFDPEVVVIDLVAQFSRESKEGRL
jgi:hypothetical protein